MVVALQAGMLAGGVVFVPMALAGWHLTRNRVLFFSAALFIVLAVSVHLLPYFPAMSSILYSLHSPWPYQGVLEPLPSTDTPINCISHLHDVVWEEQYKWNHYSSFFVNYSSRDFYWLPRGRASDVCYFQKLKTRDMVDLLRGTWIVVAGDSELRFFFLVLLDLLMLDANPTRHNLPLEKHSNFLYIWEEENIKFQYIWAPYTVNLTELVVDFRHNRTYPDVLIMGAGLWHMLHKTNSTHYGDKLVELQTAVISLFPSSSYTKSQPTGIVDTSSKDTLQVPHLFWLNLPTLINSMLNTEKKRIRMMPEVCELYDSELRRSKLLRPEGPLTLLNLKTLSRGCGPVCTLDGMHYNYVTYEAAVHVMVNALLIATQQLPAT